MRLRRQRQADGACRVRGPDDAGPRRQVVETALLDARPGAAARRATSHDTALYNAGVESEITKSAAALITRTDLRPLCRGRRDEMPAGLPLYISGGCGLNCDWNSMWRELGHFSSVFVPPCANDSGSALGTAIDALIRRRPASRGSSGTSTAGSSSSQDAEPDQAKWDAAPVDDGGARGRARRRPSGRVGARAARRWARGRSGTARLLAEPFNAATRDRLNEIKLREDYRPIAPSAGSRTRAGVRPGLPGPVHALFPQVTVDNLGAVTHVDGSARAPDRHS